MYDFFYQHNQRVRIKVFGRECVVSLAQFQFSSNNKILFIVQ